MEARTAPSTRLVSEHEPGEYDATKFTLVTNADGIVPNDGKVYDMDTDDAVIVIQPNGDNIPAAVNGQYFWVQCVFSYLCHLYRLGKRNFTRDMEFHAINDTGVAEVIADGVVINSAEDGVDLIGNIYYQGFDKVILHQENVSPDFFDLKTGMAGEILQKFSNYRVRLAIVGDFSTYTSKSLRDFIHESNKGKLVNFLSSKEEAINRLSIA